MIKRFQTITDKDHGNCMQAAIASLFEEELDKVPNFREFESWFPPMRNFIDSRGYEYQGTRHNKIFSRLLAPTDGCFKEIKWHIPSTIFEDCLAKNEGTQGYISKRGLHHKDGKGQSYFYASVLSPYFFNWKTLSMHAVIIDKNLNIVHDPNPEYADIKQYPLAEVLGHNGIIDIMLLNPKREVIV